MDITYEGAPLKRMTFSRGSSSNFGSRRAALRYVNFSGYGWFPSASIEASAYDTHLGNQESEVDKLVDRLALKRCTGNFVSFQSASVNDALIEDSKIATSLNGTPTRITIRRSEMASLRLHPGGQGWTDEAVVEDSIYGEQQLLKKFYDIASFTSIEDGISVRPVADGPIANALPGARWFIFTSDGNTILGYVGRVTEVRQNGSDVEVVTTMAGGIPTFTGTFAAARVGSIGVGTATFSGNSGCAAAVEMSLAPAGTKLMEYMNRNYDGSVRAHVGLPAAAQLVGYLHSFKVDVQQPYTGIAPASSAQGIPGLTFNYRR